MLSAPLVISLLCVSVVALPKSPAYLASSEGTGLYRRQGTSNATNKLPACDATPQACQCPAGTSYQASTSYAVIFADTGDVTELISNFTNTAWFGTVPDSISGPPSMPIRHLVGDVDGVAVPSNEQLTLFTDYSGKNNKKTNRKPDGFYMKFQLVDTPVSYTGATGPGILGGSWDIMNVRKMGNRETLWIWSIYACFSSAFAFNEFHDAAMNNIISTLEKQRKLTKKSIGPYYV